MTANRSLTALLRRPIGGELAGTGPAVAQARQCARAVADAVREAGTRGRTETETRAR